MSSFALPGHSRFMKVAADGADLLFVGMACAAAQVVRTSLCGRLTLPGAQTTATPA